MMHPEHTFRSPRHTPPLLRLAGRPVLVIEPVAIHRDVPPPKKPVVVTPAEMAHEPSDFLRIAYTPADRVCAVEGCTTTYTPKCNSQQRCFACLADPHVKRVPRPGMKSRWVRVASASPSPRIVKGIETRRINQATRERALAEARRRDYRRSA